MRLEKKEYAMQLLVGFGFSSCEFRMYYPITKYIAAKEDLEVFN